MMKLIKIIAFSFLLMVSVNMESRAFFPPVPPGPLSPTVDGGTDAAAVLNNLAATAQANATQYMAYLNDLTKQAKALKAQYMDQFTGFVDGAGDKLKGALSKEKESLPGAKTIQESKIADIYDAESVRKAMYTLFLAYPMDCNKDPESFNDCKDYRAKAEEFYQDTIIEIYTAVRQLELTIPELESTVTELSTTFSGGGGGGAESDDSENSAWKNSLNAYETMDKILQLIEELNAMNAQYEAALFLREQIIPAAYVPQGSKKAAKTSAYMPAQTIQTASLEKYVHSETLVFGQMAMIAQSSDNVSVQKAASAEFYEEDDEEEYEYDPDLYGKVKFADAPKPPLKSVFEGNREKLLELDKVTPLYKKSLDAKEVHNLLQALDSYRDLFEDYETTKKLHQKALQAVAAVDQCAIQYLGRHYTNPEKIWKGSMPDAAINDYDARQGISGWAVKAFEIAKSEDATSIDESDMAAIDVDMDTDINDPNSEDKIKADMEKKRKDGFTGFKNANKEAEVQKATRETQMISFDIGAEAAQTLVKDQYSTKPKWGTPSVKFPVWNDQLNFYTQYIDGKYVNIKDYLHQLDVNAVIVDIAYELNDILTTDEDERQNNRTGLDRLSARLKKETQVTDPIAVLEEVEKNHEQLMNQALQNKNKQLQGIENQKTILQSSLNNVSAVKTNYSEQLNTISQDKLKADIGMDVYEKQIDNLNERRGDDEDNQIRESDVEYEEETVETPETTRTIQETEVEETTGKKLLFDTDSAIEDYKDNIQKLKYQVKQQEAAQAAENANKASLQAPVEKKNLFRQRPFSDNSGYAPLNTPKYSLSQTLYFGAEFPAVKTDATPAKAGLSSLKDRIVQSQAAVLQAGEGVNTGAKVSAVKDKVNSLQESMAQRPQSALQAVESVSASAKEAVKAEAKAQAVKVEAKSAGAGLSSLKDSIAQSQAAVLQAKEGVNTGAKVSAVKDKVNSLQESLAQRPQSVLQTVEDVGASAKGIAAKGIAAPRADLESLKANKLKSQAAADLAKAEAQLAKETAKAQALQSRGNLRPQGIINTEPQAVNNAARVQLMPVTANSNKNGSLSLHPESNAMMKMPTLSNSGVNMGIVSSGATQHIDYFQEKAKLDKRLETQTSQQIDTKNITTETVAGEEAVAAVKRSYTNKIRSEKMKINKEDGDNMALSKLEMAKNAQEAADKEKKALQLKSLVKAKEQESTDLTQKIEVANNKIKAIEMDHAAQIQQIEQAYDKKREEAQIYINNKRKARETLDLISYYTNKIGLPSIGEDGVVPAFSLLHILRTATDLTDDARSYADQLIDDAHKSIINLGDGIYVGEHSAKIQEIHNNLMTKLQSLPIDGLSKFSSKIKTYEKTSSVMKPLTSIFQKILLQQACKDNNCKKVDSDYFVGLVAKERDFMAPKAAPKEYLPPLREIVYFDDIDYENMNVAADGSVTRENFLNSGRKFPEIWKRILKGKAFVDKDVDLKTLLSEGNETPAFMRGGRYPCRLGDQIIDMKDADAQFTVYDSRALPKDATTEEKAYRPREMSAMLQCKEISIEGKGGQGNYYATVRDMVEDVTASARVKPFQSFSKGGIYSELGTLLKFTEQGLFFNAAPLSTMKHLEKMTAQASKSSSYKQNMPDIVYQKALLKDNQFGNFLSFVEQEISYRQSLEELEMRIDEAKEILFEQFEKIGFKPSATYNLANPEDYRLTKEVLTNRKNTLLNEGFADMEKIKVKDNDIVEERIKKIKNILTAARKDKNAYIPISDTIDSGAELDESIKTEEVNHQVMDKHKQRADEELKKQISSFPIPFCAAY